MDKEKYLGCFLGKEMYGNKGAELCLEYQKNEIERLESENLKLEMELFRALRSGGRFKRFKNHFSAMPKPIEEIKKKFFSEIKSRQQYHNLSVVPELRDALMVALENSADWWIDKILSDRKEQRAKLRNEMNWFSPIADFNFVSNQREGDAFDAGFEQAKKFFLTLLEDPNTSK